jgi:N-acyl-D-aspartate/D-glutamate deacylase
MPLGQAPYLQTIVSIECVKAATSMIWGMEDSTFLGLAGIVAGVGAALVTTLLNLWWNYKTRGLPYQQALYQKQIEAYTHLTASLANVLQPYYGLLRAHRENPTAEDIVKMRNKIRELLEDYTLRLVGDMFLIPREIVQSVNRLYGVLWDLATTGIAIVTMSDGGIREVGMADSFEVLNDAHLRILNTIREKAHIEALSEFDWIVGQRRPKTDD